jgi:hypothetical protein
VKLERLVRDKQYSLLGISIIYASKTFYRIDPCGHNYKYLWS